MALPGNVAGVTGGCDQRRGVAADMTATLGVVLVNWRGAADTLECLESLAHATIPLRVIVVDNASGDGSLERIAAWARGEELAIPRSPEMARFSTPPTSKPVTWQQCEPGETGDNGAWLTLIDSGGNLGFAGGNNVGLRFVLADPAIRYVWLLNNDTVVEPGAPAALLTALEAAAAPGMCGTVVRYYHRPGTLQALNGSTFNAWTGTSAGIAFGQPAATLFDAADVARKTDFVLGASLAVTRAFVETVGEMEESYFLYCEEIDWAWRNNGQFEVIFAAGAIVYHKEGGSIGSSGQKGMRSDLSEYYLLRSKLQLISRHRPWLLPVHWGVAASQIALRLWRRQPAKALVMTRALLGLKT